MARYTFKIMPIGGIARDFHFATHYRMEDPALTRSVAKLGIAQPLMVTHGEVPELLSGHRRFHAALAVGLKELPVFQLTEDLRREDLFMLAALANWNSYSDLDRCWTLHRAMNDFQWNEAAVIDLIFPCLGLEPSRHNLIQYLEIGMLHPKVLDAVAQEVLPFRGIRMLGRWKRENQEAFVPLIAERTSLTTNQLIKAVEWLFDGMRSASSVDLASYLHHTHLDKILSGCESDRRPVTERFMKALRVLRFPRLAKQEESFARFSRKIHEECRDLSLEAPPSFEGEGYVLKARIPKRETVEQLLRVLAEKKESLQSIFKQVL